MGAGPVLGVTEGSGLWSTVSETVNLRTPEPVQ